MYLKTKKVKLCCLVIISGVLAGMGEILHRSLDRLNSLWYRFSIYCLEQVARWPNQSMGELRRVTYTATAGTSLKETWVQKMDSCEMLIILFFIVIAVIPLGIVMALVEIVNRKRLAIQQRHRVGSRRCLHSIGLSTL